MRYALLVLVLIMVCVVTFGIGLYAGVKQTWPVAQLRRLVSQHANPPIVTDRFGRLLSYPGKIEIPCPARDDRTAVLLVIGQSNAANYQGQRYQSKDDRVVNFVAGRCYRAASPLLGADGRMGETWTLLGIKILRSGLYHAVILIPVAVGGSEVRRWAEGGDLNAVMLAAIQATKARYTITGVLLDQGAADFGLRTPEARYRSELASLIGSLRAAGVRAPFFITRCSVGADDWTADNPIARAQASLADDQRGIFDGPNTDRDVTTFDRYDGYHFSASGQEKYTDAWLPLLRAHPGVVERTN
jgi:hypothetical protein